MVNIVLLLLKIDVNDDTKADIMTANMRPLSPTGMIFKTSLGYAILVQPALLPHISIHWSGSPHPTSSVM